MATASRFQTLADDMSWKDYPYLVQNSRLVTPVIRELQLTPLGAELPYRAGQYVLLADCNDHVPHRSYSVANMPDPSGMISLLVTLVPGGPTSTWAHTLRRGDRVMLTGPYGTFVPYRDVTRPVLLLLLLAAGSGLAPARAIAEAVLAEEPARPVTLFFSGRTGADAIDRARFEQWAATRPRFRYLLTLTRDPHEPMHSRIPGLLTATVGELAGWEVFASGPSGFVTGCAVAARALGADAGLIHTEEFFAEPSPWVGRPPSASEPSVRT